MSSTRVAVCGMMLLLAGCAGGTTPSPEGTPADAPVPEAGSPRFNAELVTETELDQSSLGDVDALTVIKQLRPRYLSSRGLASASDRTGGSVQVTIDNGPLTGLAVLTSIRKSEIQEIRYLNTASAAQRFGSLAKAGPVIMVRRK